MLGDLTLRTKDTPPYSLAPHRLCSVAVRLHNFNTD